MAKLWLISQDANDDYDTFDSAVVVAETEDAARKIHPYGRENTEADGQRFSCWAAPEQVKAEYIGETERPPGEVICASFNAG